MKKKAIIISGYFNPIHKGHIEYINLSKSHGDILIVIVNNDIQRELKGSMEFMLQEERKLIISNIRAVDKVYISIDDDKSVSKTISLIHSELHKDYTLFFANGGDQNNNSIPEITICEKLGIKLLENMGKKVQSSSWLIKKI